MCKSVRGPRSSAAAFLMPILLLVCVLSNLQAGALSDSSWNGTFGASNCVSPTELIQSYTGSTPPSFSVGETCTTGVSVSGSMSGAGGTDPQLQVNWSSQVSLPQIGHLALGALDLSYEAIVEPADPSHPVTVPSVPVILTFSALSSCSNTDASGHVDNGFSSWSVSGPMGTVSGGCSSDVATGNGSYQRSFSVQPGQPITIEASVNAQVNSGTTDPSLLTGFSTLNETASAMVDPLMQIDPSFLDLSDFVIKLSPSLGASVPEPWMPLPLGTAMLGIVLLSRRLASRG